MTELSVREWIKKIQVKLRSGNVPPSELREDLMTLTSLLGNCQVELTRTDAAYTVVLARELQVDQKAAHAEIRAKLSDEYKARQEARDVHTLCVELIRSVKTILRSLEEEMRLGASH